MVTEVVIKVPDANQGSDMDYIHDAAKRLGTMTPSGNVEFSESKMFKPVTNGSGGDNWASYNITAACSDALFDETAVREIHKMLVQNISVPDEVAIETQVTAQDIYLVG